MIGHDVAMRRLVGIAHGTGKGSLRTQGGAVLLHVASKKARVTLWASDDGIRAAD